MGTWDIWAERATSAYSGKGPAKARGYEHHVVSFGRKPKLSAEVAFENFGVTRYTVEASGGAKPASKISYSDGLEITCRVNATGWAGVGDDRGALSEFVLSIDAAADAPVLPSFIARWIGVGSTESKGSVGRYVPVPEDGFGAWMPPRKQWFAVMGLGVRSVVTEVVVQPVEAIRIGRVEVAARKLAHIDRDGKTVAVLYLDPESGAPRRYERTGCVLTVVDEAVARARAPKS